MKNTIKKIFVIFLTLLVISVGLLNTAEAYVRVRGYYKPSTGSYVMPHYRTSPNSNKWDNWSTKGNYNPYTEKKGTIDPFRFYYRW